jgi:hypothetical protein
MQFRKTALLGILAAGVIATCAADRPQFLRRAEVRHLGKHVTVFANYPRPLERVLSALRDEYGWIIDFEDPPYESSFDLVDDTDEAWRRAHPDAKGVTRIRGGAFTTEFDEGSNMGAGSSDEERILRKVVSDYNASGNPGNFVVTREGPGRLAVIGVSVRNEAGQPKSASPLLDTVISLPQVDRTTAETVQLILSAVGAKTGAKVALGNAPLNFLLNSRVTVGGDMIPARDLLLQAVSSPRLAISITLLYDADVPIYFVNLSVVTKLGFDSRGTPLRVPVTEPK